MSYVDRQEKWLKENHIRKGDLLRITHIPDKMPKDWHEIYYPEMGYAGHIVEFESDHADFGLRCHLIAGMCSWYYPYTIFERVSPSPIAILIEMAKEQRLIVYNYEPEEFVVKAQRKLDALEWAIKKLSE